MTILFWMYLLFFSHRITPTYSCFTDTVYYMEVLLNSNNAYYTNGELSVMHGICADIRNQYGHKYFHSWIEIKAKPEPICIFGARVDGKDRFLKVPKSKFYKHFAVMNAKPYTPTEVCYRIYLLKSFGPWPDDPGARRRA